MVRLLLPSEMTRTHSRSHCARRRDAGARTVRIKVRSYLIAAKEKKGFGMPGPQVWVRGPAVARSDTTTVRSCLACEPNLPERGPAGRKSDAFCVDVCTCEVTVFVVRKRQCANDEAHSIAGRNI